MGIKGLGLASFITSSIVFILLIMITNLQSLLKPALIWPDQRIFSTTGLKQYLSLGLPATMMSSIEQGMWNYLILVSGWIGVLEQDVTIII